MLCHMVLLVSDARRERLSGLRVLGTLRQLGRQYYVVGDSGAGERIIADPDPHPVS